MRRQQRGSEKDHAKWIAETRPPKFGGHSHQVSEGVGPHLLHTRPRCALTRKRLTSIRAARLMNLCGQYSLQSYRPTSRGTTGVTESNRGLHISQKSETGHPSSFPTSQ